jgi:RHS repeat-associated protein
MADQECETNQYEQYQTGLQACSYGSDLCEPGVLVGSTRPIVYNGETSISIHCRTKICGTSDEEEVPSTFINKCPSQTELQFKKVAQDLYAGSCRSGSIIQAENRILGESVPIVGADFNFNYFTSWVEGRKADRSVRANLAPARAGMFYYVVPVKYDINIYVGEMSGAIGANPAVSETDYAADDKEFVWDGLDENGNPILGGTKVKTVITTKALAGNVDLVDEIFVGSLKAIYLGLGGWLPSNYYFYDPSSSLLYSGDGEKQKIKVTKIVGGGYYYAIDDATKVLFFNSTGRITTIKSGLLGTTLVTYNYTSAGYLASIVEPFGKTTYFNRDSAGKFTSITAANGKITNVTINTAGYLASVTNPMNQTHSFTYGYMGLLQTFTKPGGQVSTFGYDYDGNLASDTHSGGFFWELFKSSGVSTPINSVIESPMGRQSRFEGSWEGDVLRSTEYLPTGGENKYYSEPTTIERESRGVTHNEGLTVDPRFPDSRYVSSFTYRDQVRTGVGVTTTRQVTLLDSSDPFSIDAYSIDTYGPAAATANTTYNPSAKTFTTVTGSGVSSVVGIDSYERTISEKQGSLAQINYGYTQDKLTSITQSTRVTSFGYNSTTGYLESVTNPLNQSTLFSYNDAGELIGQVGPDLRTVAYQRDANGNISGITPFGRPIHQFTINANELPSGYQPPILSGVTNVNTTYSYNDDKQLTQVTKPNGQSINYSYDLTTGLMTGFTAPAGNYVIETNMPSELPSKITMPNGFSSYINWANTEGVYYAYHNASDTMLYSYAKNYESNGNLSSDVVTNPSGTLSSISYEYDNDNRPWKAGDMVMTYNTPNGQLTTVKMGTSSTTGFTDTYTYNTFGEVTGYTAKRGPTTLYTMTLTRDALGRIDTKSQTMNSATDAYVYGFDTAGRLQQVTKNSSVVANYGYDSNSNRNSGNVGAQTTTATYDDQDRLTAYNSLTFTYNANGDLLTKTNTVTSTTTQYTYDVFGNLTQVILPGGATAITYEVDGLNRRVGMKVNGVVQKRWVYQDQYRIAAEMNSAGTITKRFVYGSKGNIPDYMIASGVKYRIISDQLGSPRLVVKQSDGTISQRMNHDEFGRVTEDTNPGFIPFGFAGGLYESQTGLVRFGARDYDPEIGRWTAKDPIRFKGGDVNLYAYVHSDPINYFDMRGKDETLAIVITTGAAIVSAPTVVAGVAFVASAVVVGYGISKAIDYFVESRSLPKNGPPNDSLVLPDSKDPTKKWQERFYDDKGNPIKDIDYGHDHGQGNPHVHDWGPDGRGGPRPPNKGECP